MRENESVCLLYGYVRDDEEEGTRQVKGRNAVERRHG